MNSTRFQKTKHACIVDAHESTRKRMESTLPKDHEDHIAQQGFNSMSHYNLLHNFIPMLQAKKFRMRKQQWTQSGRGSKSCQRGN